MTGHPPPADLERLVRGTLSAGEKQRLLSHLLGRCPRCCSALVRFGGFDLDAASEVATEDYSIALDRAFATACRIAAPRQQAADTLASLLAGSGEQAGCPVVEPTTLRGLPRVQGLIEAARR